jgi:ABC-type nitrate/sulfonate/bicarbonate transport system ATPase subunit
MKTIFTLQNVYKTFVEDKRRLQVLENISLHITEGEFFVMVGPSGSGKSTLLRIISALEKEFVGNLTRDPSAEDMGFVFQQFGLLPWLTVYQNIELGLLSKKLPAHHLKQVIDRELKQFQLEKFAHIFPRDLSGGMQQRVGLARAFATDPKVIFLDEPFSELDSFTANELRQELLRVWQERKLTVIMVTHIIEEAIELADRVAVLTPRPGRIEKIVTNTLARPRSRRSPEFFTLADELYQLIKP